ncbi:hypothetical protein [Mesobacillus sp.]|uniref:hypothetical protein n=1 Tax=Mesobacillus sp. TaxID=2675271 RepID=UPI0039EEE52C
MKNEKGYALVLVLLIITLTFTFAISLSGMALSARKQFNKTDEINRATDLAEMGVAHYEAILSKLVKNANDEARQTVQTAFEAATQNPNTPIPNYDDLFYISLSRKLTENPSVILSIDEGNSYEILNPIIAKHVENISISFNSKGKTVNEEKELKGKLTINKNTDSRDGEFIPNRNTFENIELDDFEIKGGKQEETYTASTYFQKTVTLKGNTTLIIKGDTFFNSDVTLKGGDTIFIFGDAYFYKPLSPIIKGEKSKICILGTPYLLKNQKLVEYTSFDGGDTDSCPKPILDNEWSIDPDNGMKVEY